MAGPTGALRLARRRPITSGARIFCLPARARAHRRGDCTGAFLFSMADLVPRGKGSTRASIAVSPGESLAWSLPKRGRVQLLKLWSEANSGADLLATVHPPLKVQVLGQEKRLQSRVTMSQVERGNTEGQAVFVSGFPLCIADSSGQSGIRAREQGEGHQRDRRLQVQHSHTHSTLK